VRVTNHVAILFSMTSEVLSAGISSSTNYHQMCHCIACLIIEEPIFEYYISKRIELLAKEIYIKVGNKCRSISEVSMSQKVTFAALVEKSKIMHKKFNRIHRASLHPSTWSIFLPNIQTASSEHIESPYPHQFEIATQACCKG